MKDSKNTQTDQDTTKITQIKKNKGLKDFKITKLKNAIKIEGIRISSDKEMRDRKVVCYWKWFTVHRIYEELEYNDICLQGSDDTYQTFESKEPINDIICYIDKIL